MTIENGGEQPANDTALPQAIENTNASQNTEVQEGESAEGEEGQQQAAAPEDEEVDYEGQKYRVPKAIKDSLLRQADYTRKTQEVAEMRKALEGERESFATQTSAQRAHFQEAARVMAFNEQLAPIEARIKEYANVDWNTLRQTNRDSYEQHRDFLDGLKAQRDGLKEQRDAAARAWTDKEREFADKATRESGERIAKAEAEIAKHLPEWKRGSELDLKLEKYAKGLGYSDKEIVNLALSAPRLLKDLDRLRTYDEAAAKQKQQQTFEQSQQARPVTRVGGGGGSSQLKTTDSSGDRLSTEEWARRERERVRKKA